MSNMLEQAIIDAAALREAALKNAEQSIIEKYAPQIKKAVAEMGVVMTLKGDYRNGLQKIKEGYGSIIFNHITSTMKIDC